MTGKPKSKVIQPRPLRGSDDRTTHSPAPLRRHQRAPAVSSLPAAKPAAPANVETADATPRQSTLAETVGRKLAWFEDIIIPTPQNIGCVRQMDTLRIMGLNQPAGQQRRGYRYLNESGSGKSTCAKLLKKHVEAQPDRPAFTKPVLHVTLSTTGTPKSLASSILSEVGNGYSIVGEAEILLERVKTALEEFKVELLIIDELNHFKQKNLAKDAANTIKNILTKGWVPIVLMGTADAKSLFDGNRELKMRCAPQVVLAPYDHENPDDHKIWTEFVSRLDAEMVARGIVDETAGLGEPNLAQDLCEASNGLIGELHNILMAALEQTLLNEERSISYERLVEAVDAWCLQDHTINHNPLRIRGQQKG